MKKLIAILMIIVSLLVLTVGCETTEPTVVEKILVPDVSVFRYDVYERFPLIENPQFDADLMYNNLVTEMAWAMEKAYGDMMQNFNKTLRELLNK